MNTDEMLAGYVTCALWSSTTDDGTPMDDEYDTDDIASEALAEMRQDVEAFADSEADDLDGMDAGQAGHDFWLTRNHHGAGFWDRGLGERGDRLTAAAQSYGSVDLYVGDDGKIYS
jgi:hypothetical protein